MGCRSLATTLLLTALAAGEHSNTGTVVGRLQVRNSGAPNVVVYLTGFTQTAPPETPRISQKNKTFIPDLLPIVVGQSVEFANEDNIIHNVFSTSKARTFDLGKPRVGESRKVKFEQTGLVDVYCDIHEQMMASILVLPNRAFAVTGPDGRFTIKDVPPGHYPLFAWSRRSEPIHVEVDVSPGEQTAVELTLTETKFDPKHLGKYGQPYRPQPDYAQ